MQSLQEGKHQYSLWYILQAFGFEALVDELLNDGLRKPHITNFIVTGFLRMFYNPKSIIYICFKVHLLII
jgi:hypothetical protein